MDSAEGLRKPALEVKPPQFLKARAIIAINLYGFVVGLPVLLAFGYVSFRPLDTSSYFVPVLAVILATIFLPVGFGNPHARLLGQRIKPPFPASQARVVQLTVWPRIFQGVRATVEDADDIGHLRVTENGVEFFGDSVHLRAPFGAIQSVRLENIGLRGLFIYAPRILMTIDGLQPSIFEVADRSSFWLPGARRETQKLYFTIAAGVSEAKKRAG